MTTSQKKNILIGGLLVVVVIMGIAYAAFASNLTITGTANTTNNWDIEIISVDPDKTAGGTSPNYTTAGDIAHSIGTDKLSAQFQAALISPGDSVEYTIEVENKGSLDAVLSTLTKTDSNNDYIEFEIEGIQEGDTLPAGQTKEFTATVKYKNIQGGQQQPASTTGNFGISLQYTQDGAGSTPASGSGSGSGSAAPDGTIYAFNTGGAYIGRPFWFSYETDYTSLNRNVFNKYVISGGIITEAWSCTKFSFINEPVCVQGSTDGSTYKYQEDGGNWKILNDLSSTFTANSGSCSFYSDYSYCSAGDLGVDAGDGGNVSATDSSASQYCNVINSDGAAYCGE